MDVIWWTWTSEHEQLFFGIFYWHWQNILEIDLTHGIKYLVMWKNILPCVYGWKMRMDELFNECW